MAVFITKVRDAKGQAVTREIEATNITEVRGKLKEQGLFPMEITQKAAAGNLMELINKKIDDRKKVKLKDLTIFSRQFSTMINAGVSLVRTLNILAEQSSNPKFRRVISEIRTKVEEGNSLSDALRDYPKVFQKLYVSMVKAGETGGVLDEVLDRLATFLEKQAKLEGQIKSAMVYPLVVLFVATAIFLFLLTFVLPIFKDMFDSMNAKLPAFTQMLIDMSGVVRTKGVFVVMGIVGSVWGFKRFINTTYGRRWFDATMLKAPVFGPLLRKTAVARFTRTLGTLLRSGVPLMGSLEIVQDTAGNTIIAEAISKVREAVREGEGLTKKLEETGVFPPMVTQMIAIGEETGAMDDMLSRIADFYDNEVEEAVKALTSLLEPIMMVGIGGMVGSIIIGMYLPMFSIIGAIQ
ncbi:MAG: type II secretion system F family protein [Candidatus Sericytochromatia bacterium]|nr:type II secretion system F family protein [Candidatus Sericytochromatia bacterium]